MTTVNDFLQDARYDLVDYGDGLAFDNRELYTFLNRLIKVMDSQLIALSSDLMLRTESQLSATASQNYVDLTAMNNGLWDSIRSVWIDDDELYGLPMDWIHWKQKWRSGDQYPYYWAIDGRVLRFDADADDAHSLTIHYDAKTRPRLQTWTASFEGSATYVDTTNDTITVSAATFVTGDGPFQFTNSGGSLPGGVSESTDYYLVYDPTLGNTEYCLATSKVNALEGSCVDITSTGSGTHTITMQPDMMPYDSIFDEYMREMLVMHARAKKEGQLGTAEAYYDRVFRKRAMEETIRRKFYKKHYKLDF
jgi:hypothetical protein